MMRLKLLGASGLRVSELCLGTMTFGTDWGWGADEATCRAMVERFVEAGGTFFDTSNNYTNGTSTPTARASASSAACSPLSATAT